MAMINTIKKLKEIQKKASSVYIIQTPKDTELLSTLYIELESILRQEELQHQLTHLGASNRIPSNQKDYNHLKSNIIAVTNGALADLKPKHRVNKLYGKKNHKLFISHAFSDRKWITKIFFESGLVELLKLSKEDVFYTSSLKTGVPLSKKWKETIKNSLLNAEVILFMVTPNFRKREVCLNEIGLAWSIEEEKTIIPIVFEPLNHSNFSVIFSDTQALQITDSNHAEYFISQLQLALDINHVDEEKKLKVAKSILSVISRNKKHIIENNIVLTNNGSKYLLVQDNFLELIPDNITYQLLGYNLLQSYAISKTDLKNYKIKTMPSLKECLVIKEDKSVNHWVLRNDYIHHIPNYQTRIFLEKLNKWARKENIIPVSKVYLNHFKRGESLVSIMETTLVPD